MIILKMILLLKMKVLEMEIMKKIMKMILKVKMKILI